VGLSGLNEYECRSFCVLDVTGGRLARSVAINAALVMSTGAERVLIVDASSDSHGDDYLKHSTGIRELQGLRANSDYLKNDSLVGYLACGRSFGVLNVSGQSMLSSDLGLLSSSYTIIVFAMDARGFSSNISDGLLASFPALIVATPSREELAISAQAIRTLIDKETMPVPVAYSLTETNAGFEKRISQFLHMPSWGSSNNSPSIANRILKNATVISKGVEIFDLYPSREDRSNGNIPSSILKGNDMRVVGAILSELRDDPEFKSGALQTDNTQSMTGLRVRVRAASRKILLSLDLKVEDLEAVISRAVDDAVGLGPLEPFMADELISEIIVNGPDEIFIERSGCMMRTDASFSDDEQLRSVIERLIAPAGRRIDESSPMVDARLRDGSRLNAVISPIAVDGSLLTIRKFVNTFKNPDALISSGMLTKDLLEFLNACVRSRVSVVISGGTGTGKTTLLGVLANAINVDERVITIEDAAELDLQVEHLVRLETKPANIEGRGEVTMRDLVRNALRMRPDRIVVGECRGAEALDMLQAMNTGHEGSMSTVHANSPRDALSRLETMVLMGNFDLPIQAVRDQITRAIDLIVQVERAPDGKRRVVEISELVGQEGEAYSMQSITRMDDIASGHLLSSGFGPSFSERLKKRGIVLPKL